MIQRMFVTLDTKKTNYKNVGKINHGDDLILELTVLSDGNMISFNDPMVDLLVKKSDGKMIRQNYGIEHIKPNKFIIEVSKDCVTSPGLSTNQLVINDNGRISTCMFYYTILNSLEEDIIESISNVEVLEQLDEFTIQMKDKMENFDEELQNRMSELEDAIDDLVEFFGDTSVDLLEAELSRNEAEQSRAQAESVRVQNESRRLQNDLDLENAEAERVRAENVRIQNEVDRAFIDAVMDQKESKREDSELERIQNESKRAADEVIRQQNENVRQSNEATRIANESDRKTQENRRATAETNRVNAETTRRNNENSRISNETERQKAMNEMKSLIDEANGFDERIGVIEDEIDEINSSLDNKAHKTFVTVDEFKNGVSDTIALKNALNSGYKIIDGDNQTYIVTGEVSIPSNVELRNIRILRGFDGGVLLRNGDSATNITINNVSLQHNNYESTGLLLLNCSNITIKNSYISTKTGFSIQLEGATNIDILDTKIDNVQLSDLSLNYTDGIHIYGGCSNINIDNCNIICGDDGIGISIESENDTIQNYDTVKNIFINNCNIDTNARAFCITVGKTRVNPSYFDNIHFTNINAKAHGTIYVKKKVDSLVSNVTNVILDNVKIYSKFIGTPSQYCHFEDMKNCTIRNSFIQTKSTVKFKNCDDIKVKNCDIDMINTILENVINYDNVINSTFSNIEISGNNTNVNSLNLCNNNVFENYKIKECIERNSNAFVGTGQGNVFKGFVLNGEKLIDFYISSSTFLNNIIDGFIYYNSKQAPNLATANIVGTKIIYPKVE